MEKTINILAVDNEDVVADACLRLFRDKGFNLNVPDVKS